MSRTLCIALALSLFGACQEPAPAEPPPIRTIYWQQYACAKPVSPIYTSPPLWIPCVFAVAPENGNMAVYVSWETKQHGAVDKVSDTRNRNLYLTDNLGRRYDHVGTRGAASGHTAERPASRLTGEFLFPAPPPDAIEFTFHDDEHGIVVEKIRLTPETRSDAAMSARILGNVTKATVVAIVDDEDGYVVRGTPFGALIRGPKTRVVSRATFERFLETLAHSPIVEGDYNPYTPWSDWFSSNRIEVTTGNQTIEFFSRSHGTQAIPWAVRVGEKTYVVPSGTPYLALNTLSSELWPLITRQPDPGGIGFGFPLPVHGPTLPEPESDDGMDQAPNR